MDLVDELDATDRALRHSARKSGRSKPTVVVRAKRPKIRGVPDDIMLPLVPDAELKQVMIAGKRLKRTEVSSTECDLAASKRQKQEVILASNSHKPANLCLHAVPSKRLRVKTAVSKLMTR